MFLVLLLLLLLLGYDRDRLVISKCKVNKKNWLTCVGHVLATPSSSDDVYG